MSDTTIFRLRIKGRVQGVGYREWAIGEANARGLHGWIRNRSDGSVELLIAGPDATVQEMLSACTRGPEAAQVESIDILNETELPPSGFARKPTL
ncbi:MAG: acylphosphatase [Micropepsaceae bacterium]